MEWPTCGQPVKQPLQLVRERHEGRQGWQPTAERAGGDRHMMPLLATQFLAAVYGAHFGAGVGIMMLAILDIFLG